MAVRGDQVYRVRKVSLVFATAAVALLVSLIWWIKADYQRPWRQWQHRYFDMQAELNHIDAEAVRSAGYQKKIYDAQAALKDATARLETEQGPRLADLQARAESIRGDYGRAELAYKKLQAELSVARADHEKMNALKGPEDSATIKARQSLRQFQEDYDQAKSQLDRISDEQHAIERQQENLYSQINEARRRLERLEKKRDDALRKEREFSSKLQRTLLNLPLFDFLAPAGTPGRTEIKEVVLPDIEHDLHFAKTARTDRCMTCHIAIDDPRFTKEHLTQINRDRLDNRQSLLPMEQPLLAHPDLDLFVSKDSPHPIRNMGCTVCHEGTGEETDFILAGHTPASDSQRQEWVEKYYVRRAGFVPEHTFRSAQERLTQPIVLPKYSAAGCTNCHAKVADIDIAGSSKVGPRINRGRFDFTVLGCANCHLVQELADARQVGTDLSHVGQKLSRGFLQQWTFQPKSFRPATRMPHSFLQENNDAASDGDRGDDDPVLRTHAEVVAISEYLLASSTRYDPQSPPADLWESLKDEHSDQNIVAADRGRLLFDKLGCLGCHANLAHRRDDQYGDTLDPLGLLWVGNDLADDFDARDTCPSCPDRLSDEERDENADFAFGLAEQMTYVRRAGYAVRHFDRAHETIFDTKQPLEPIFTRRAPELSSVRTKFADYPQAVNWLYDWLINPRHYAGDTVMPKMRLQRATVESDEALDLAVYLATLAENESFDTEVLDAQTENRIKLSTKRDELASLLLGQLNSAEQSGMIWQDEGDELTKRLVSRLAKGLSQQEAQTRTEGMDLEQKRWVFFGEQMIGHYGCYACHKIPGFENVTGPGPEFTKWGQTSLSQLDFGYMNPAIQTTAQVGNNSPRLYPPDREELIDTIGENPPLRIQHTRASFAFHKLRNPRIWDRSRLKGPYEKLKMPNFYFTTDEVEPLVSWLLSRKQTSAKQELLVDYKDTPAGRIAEGRNLARDLNCVACHRIDGNSAVLDQYHRLIQGADLVFDEINSPPPLRGEGAKVQPDWLYGFLKNVDMLRPWLEVRMPQFDLTDEQTTQLTAYFTGLSQDESHWLRNHLASLQKASETKTNRATNDLRDYAVQHRLVAAPSVDPEIAKPEAIAAADQQITEDAQFLGKLFDVPYPFTNPPPTDVTPDRLADGETIFFALECLSCHVFGDPTLPGANTKPTAQNVDLVNARLQPDWVRAWMEAPGRIQPGTKMPSLFGNGTTSAFAEFKPEDRQRIRAQLNDPTLLDDGAAQIQAISDFMYITSANKQSKVQPGGLKPTPIISDDSNK